jgi:hypothetical protein
LLKPTLLAWKEWESDNSLIMYKSMELTKGLLFI